MNLRSKRAFLFPWPRQAASCSLLHDVYLKQGAFQQRDRNRDTLNDQWLHESLPTVQNAHNQNTLQDRQIQTTTTSAW